MDGHTKYNEQSTAYAEYVEEERQIKHREEPTFGPEFNCTVCNVNTGDLQEYYMVHDFIWKEAGDTEGMLCIICLEAKLGRMLTPLDFPNLPINTLDIAPRSLILLERLGLLT